MTDVSGYYRRSCAPPPSVFARVSWRALLLLAVFCVAGAGISAPDSVRICYRKVNNFPVKYVTIDMNDPDVVVATAVSARFPRGLDSWNTFLDRLQPDAAINGTYFCTRTYMPVGDVATEGALLYRGVVGTALCITPDNHVAFRPGPRQATPDWRGFRTVLCAGPRLLANGQVVINPRAEGFRDPNVLGSATRSAVAWRADNVLIFLTVSTRISLRNLAYVCQHLNAVEAMVLDGGSSSGLFANGRTLTRPGRSMSTMLAVYATPQRFARAAYTLVPRSMPVLANLLAPAPVVAAGTSWPTSTAPSAVRPSTATPAPVTPPQVAPAVPPLLRLTRPDPAVPVVGIVPVTVEVAKKPELTWATLRINGSLRAMGNIWPLEYRWDSTKEQDGVYTIEATAWSEDRTALAREVHQVTVQNARNIGSLDRAVHEAD